VVTVLGAGPHPRTAWLRPAQRAPVWAGREALTRSAPSGRHPPAPCSLRFRTSQQTSQIGFADPAGTPGFADPAGTLGFADPAGTLSPIPQGPRRFARWPGLRPGAPTHPARLRAAARHELE